MHLECVIIIPMKRSFTFLDNIDLLDKQTLWNPFRLFLYLCVVFIIIASTQGYSQNVNIYNTDQYGLKEITPSIIIDENSTSGEYEVYAINKFGLKNIAPDEIIQNDEYDGSWKVYRVNDFGLKEMIPKEIGEENTYMDRFEIYNVNELGLKDIAPSVIVEKDSYSENIEIYNVNEFGLKELAPFEVIRRDGDEYKVYSVNKSGLPDIAPSRIIEVEPSDEVFGILLLPSIKQIKFDPENSQIKNLKRLKKLPENEFEREGWIKSKPVTKTENN